MADVTFAVGDVHGRADLLGPLQAQILAEAARLGAAKPGIVYLGDYIDRGPASRQVLDLVLDGLPGFERVALMGNHEDLLRGYLENPTDNSAFNWFRNGGDATLASYGIQTNLGQFAHEYERIRDVLFSAMPPSHRTAVMPGPNSLRLMHENDDAFFVHAGFRPLVEPVDQERHDMLWIRHEFLGSSADWGKPVVHGHTPTRYGPEVMSNRLNLDTGAYATGALTAAVLDGSAPRFLVAATSQPWHLVVDPDGLRDDAWLSWSLARAVGSGARTVGLCLPGTEIDKAVSKCGELGLQCKPLALDTLVSAWANVSSPLATAFGLDRVSVSFAGAEVEDSIRMQMASARAPGSQWVRN